MQLINTKPNIKEEGDESKLESCKGKQSIGVQAGAIDKHKI